MEREGKALLKMCAILLSGAFFVSTVIKIYSGLKERLTFCPSAWVAILPFLAILLVVVDIYRDKQHVSEKMSIQWSNPYYRVGIIMMASFSINYLVQFQ